VDDVIGRQHEVARVEAFLDLASRQTTALVIEGQAGIGKTRLWRQGVERAEARGHRVLVSRAGGSDVKLAFAGLADLLRSVDDDLLGELPPPQRRALAIALLLETGEDAPPDEHAVAAAFLGLLRRLATAGPLLVAVDDAQWLDAASLRLLEFALRRLDAEPVGALLTLRLENGQLGLPQLASAMAEERLERLRLGPMSLGALYEVIRSRLGVKFGRPTLQRIHETSRGNPFYALQLAQSLVATGSSVRPGEPLPVPEDLQALIAARFAGLSPSARETLLACAALTRPTLLLVGRVVSEPAQVADDLDEAAAAGIAELVDGEIRFAHPLLASTHYSTTPRRQRRILHGRLARAVPGREERARHLALAAAAPDAGVADELDAAAAEARGRGALRAVAELLELAVATTPDADRSDRVRRRVAAAQALLASGEAPRAHSFLDAALAESQPGSERAEVLYALGTMLMGEDIGRSAELLRQAEREAGPDDALRARILCGLAKFAYGHLIGYAETEECAREAVELAERSGDGPTLSLALALLAHNVFLRGGGLDKPLMERAVSLEETFGGTAEIGEDASAIVIYAEMLIDAEQLDSARRLLERACDRSRRSGDAGVAYPLHLLASLEFDAGQWGAARSIATEALEVAVQSGRETTEVLAGSVLGTVEAALGQVETARSLLEYSLGLAVRTGRGGRAPRYGLGLLELSLEDAAAAWAWLDPAIQRMLPLGLTEPATQVSDGVEALASLRRTKEARHLLAAFEGPAVRLGRRWAVAAAARGRGLIAMAEGDLSAAEAALVNAVGIGRTIPRPLELGRSLLALGTVERRLARKQAARATLAEALDVFDRLGASPWAARARREAGRIGGRAPRTSELSATEDEIAKLVRAGHTNKEIALALDLSVKTVEWNLTRIYRKVGVESRTELAVAAHREE
jgi:DNA-binding CsgD family transcriptional regulator